ncbi:MAG: SpoIIE family protein phosphatase [Bacteroidales bacterium]|nr:SpoIIE family protein phosphatase [Bacteroidales bacterium]
MYKFIKNIIAVSLLVTALPFAAQAQDTESARIVADMMRMPNGHEKLVAIDEVIKLQNNLDSVLKYVDMQQDLAFKTKDNEYIVKSQMQRATAFSKAYTYARAIEEYQKAIDYCDSLHITDCLGECYNAMANNLSRINDYNRASEFYNKALHQFFEQKDTSRITDVYRNLGRQCVSFHLYETANTYFSNAFKLDTLVGDNYSLALDFYNVGKSDYCQFLDLDSLSLLYKGIDKMRIAASYSADVDSLKRSLMGCYEQLMLMYVSLYAADGCPDKPVAMDSAKYHFALTDKLRKELNPHSEHVVIEITKANFLNMEGNSRESLEILYNLENKFEQGGAKFHRYRAFLYRSLIWVLKTTGRYKEAVEYSEKFKEVEETTYNREFAVKSTKALAEAEYEELIRHSKMVERDKEMYQRAQTKSQQMKTIFFAVCIILAGVLAWIIWRGLVRKRKNNSLLAKQKAEISEKNNVLNIQNQKIMSQRDEIMSQRDEIEAQRSQLSEANSRITASIRYAQRIQAAAVPSDEMMEKIFGECMVLWRPLNIVSGDFFWATQIGQYKLITAADCTGHGVPGAFMSMLGVSTLNDIAAQKDVEGYTVTAASFLDELREKIIAALRQSGPQRETQDGMDMAFCIIDPDKKELQFAGANRPLWLVRGGELIEYKADRMPVGFHVRKNSPFTNTVVKYQSGDVLYMGSDGLSDQFGGLEQNKCKFGSKKLKELLNEISQKPFAEQKTILETTIDEWRKKEDGSLEPQLDDQILVGIRLD